VARVRHSTFRKAAGVGFGKNLAVSAADSEGRRPLRSSLGDPSGAAYQACTVQAIVDVEDAKRAAPGGAALFFILYRVVGSPSV